MSEPNDTDILMNGEEWFAKNRGMLINITLVILIGVVGWNWVENSSSASSVEAESALVNVLSSDNTNLVDVARLLGGVHTQYKDEPVAERALILSAKTSVDAGDYQNAKTRFESYLSNYGEAGKWVNEAKLGKAICLEFEGDLAKAIAICDSLGPGPVNHKWIQIWARGSYGPRAHFGYLSKSFWAHFGPISNSFRADCITFMMIKRNTNFT